MASIFKKRNGWYYIQFCDNNRSPRQKQLALHTKRLRKAQTLRLQLEELFETERYDPWSGPASESERPQQELGEAIRVFMETRSNLSPYSIAKYRSVLGQFKRFLGADYPVAEIGQSDISRFLEAPTRKAVTKRTYYSTLSPLLNWLVNSGSLDVNPGVGVRLNAVPRKIPRAFTCGDIDRIVAAIEKDIATNVRASTRSSAWLIPIVMANAMLGLRAGEVVNLRWEDVDLLKRQICISNTSEFSTKNKRDRVLPVCDSAWDILAKLDRSSEYVFPSRNGNKLHRQYLSRRFKHFVIKAGLDERFNFHSLRHTAITMLVANGASLEAARQYAGHSSVRVTEIYSHLPESHYRRQIESAFTME